MDKFIAEDWDITDKGDQVIQIDDMGSSIICDLNTGLIGYKANARLIASAPALLEALKAALPYIKSRGEGGNEHIVYAQIKQALAKAEGTT